MRILNLYAGIGGNRKLWGDEHEIIALENDKDIAQVYMDLFPKDFVMIDDAHEYLLHNYMNFDFIWSSPPCQTHTSFRQNICVRYRGTEAKYPDMKLYEEILFLKYNFKGKWVVENVKPYYKPLIGNSTFLQRHIIWSNFEIQDRKFKSDNLRAIQIPDLQKKYGFDLSSYKIKNKRQVLRNCVSPELGLYVFTQSLKEQGKLL